MSRQYSDTWRPPQNSRPSYQNTHGTYIDNNNRRPRKEYWDVVNNRTDDQIAPREASRSVASLQRWALATADLPQQGHRFNETQIIERIERRYGSERDTSNAPFPRYSSGNHEPSKQLQQGLLDVTSSASIHGSAMKRPLSISPPPHGRAPAQGLSAMSYMRETKRRRTRLPSPAHFRPSSKVLIDLTEEDDVNYAQSSEWSFSGSDDKGSRKELHGARR